MNLELTDLLWYLAIGAFFFMMMRKGGCCGGHHHKKKAEKDSGQDLIEK
jgi:hypothetical protein